MTIFENSFNYWKLLENICGTNFDRRCAAFLFLFLFVLFFCLFVCLFFVCFVFFFVLRENK